MEILPDEKRQWEINAYHDLGFIMFSGCGGYLEETDRGYKNERREATSIESNLWARFANDTPEVPVLQVDDKLELDRGSFESFKVETKEKCLWLENKYEMSLYACHTDYRGQAIWYRYYTFLKEIRIPKGHE